MRLSLFCRFEMASIFTYDPDPPRVASPWLQDTATETELAQHSNTSPRRSLLTNIDNASPFDGTKSRSRVTRLRAEPQEGPVEYKLHLLLRPRRKFRSTITGSHISGSRHARVGNGQSQRSPSETVIDSGHATNPTMPPPTSSTQQTRQHRLEQLTTQLLWRLQQSCPHHTSSATNIILPSLPEALPELQAPQQLAKLLHGLEESAGALYEIGVSDDGTLVGLAEDEMQESLNNLRAMAACLGCIVEVLRKELVGECEWLEDAIVSRKERKLRRTGKLVVVEALVKPHLQSNSPSLPAGEASRNGGNLSERSSDTQLGPAATEQLRITLAGSTMSGKSTLLGTLTTSTLDNGRGKSRLSMLRHRHEITSGVTSSVTQELIGYRDATHGTVDVINYATENMASWIDIHVAASGNRLVLISDSAGHPRYRRTTVRGLVGWAPHWTLLCVPADDIEDPAGKAGSTKASRQSLGSSVSDMDLSGAQLDLCLRLHLPLVIVITKLDLASRAGLKGSLTKVLDALKAAGRKPVILANSSGEVSQEGLQTIQASAIDGAYNVALPLLNDTVEVPIVLTSSVQGTGIRNLHALLHELPIPDPLLKSLQNSGFVFQIEDVYSKPAEVEGVIVSGRLRSGQICVGDSGTLGPFSMHDLEDSEDSDERPARNQSLQLPTSRSFPGALRNALLSPPRFQLPNQEWRRFKVTSVRNLRLPVHLLTADQVGTIAVIPYDARTKSAAITVFPRIRKGMVLTALQPLSARSFVAEFRREDLESLAVGNHVVAYTASVRASARVVSARVPDSPPLSRDANRQKCNNYDPFELDDNVQMKADQHQTAGGNEKTAGTITASNLLVTFRFDASKEFIMAGDQILVMPGGGPGLYGGQERGEKGVAGLEGFVGRVTEMFS